LPEKGVKGIAVVAKKPPLGETHEENIPGWGGAGGGYLTNQQ